VVEVTWRGCGQSDVAVVWFTVKGVAIKKKMVEAVVKHCSFAHMGICHRLDDGGGGAEPG